ncbi:MAG: transcription termination/antitermination protein NusA, partial [Allobaculum sp.]
GKDDAKKEKDERRKERKKPAFNVLHPIYTDEELAEIEDNEIEEEENRYSDDIDYEDYDSYYEE